MRQKAVRCWSLPAPSTAPRKFRRNWSSPGCRLPPCRAIYRKTPARRLWTASARAVQDHGRHGYRFAWHRCLADHPGGQFDLPDTSDAYTHRTGRTGRMERLGTAISLVTPDDEPMVRTIERQLGFPMERRHLDGLSSAADISFARDQAPAQPAAPQAAAKPKPSSWRSRRPVNRSRPFPAFRPANARD